ncbi:MAG: DEAD/DEAH box helicase [Opitutales bacterium]
METDLTFEALPLAAPLHRALREKNYTTPSPIQAQAIPHLLEGRDLMGVAQTGTGKTAAFSLPILHALSEAPRRPKQHTCRALVLTPTRELAEQVTQSFISYGQHMKHLDVAQVYGGVGFGPQIKKMRRGVDVLVACPGRLLDLYEQGYIDFSQVEHFVLDEADRMLDMGFIHDIRQVAAELPQERQTLLFSATLSPEITRLAGSLLHDAVEVRVAPKETTAERCDHRVCFLQADDKLEALQHLLESHFEQEGRHLALIFSRTKHGADRLAKTLSRECNVRTEAIHGNKTQNARQRALENFRAGKAPVLVATDVAARGIDVKDVTLVVNFDLPDEPEAYVHRIGRTARAGAEGLALSFCTHTDRKELAAIERLLKAEIPVFEDYPFHDSKLASQRSPQRGGRGGRPQGKGPRRGPPKNFRRGGPPRRKPQGAGRY